MDCRKRPGRNASYPTLLEQRGFDLPSSFIKKVRGKIWELRPGWSGTEYRFFYVMMGRRLVVLHAIQKQSQKLKERDIQ
jgi:phage-related protein